MKKMFLLLVACVMSVAASAFDFDGINLNNNVSNITLQIAKKGYYFDEAANALTGNCRGTKIFLTMNTTDVSVKGKLGQLIVDIPMDSKDALQVVTTTFNVVYHLLETNNGINTYQADNDGTTVSVSSTGKGVRLVYNTPYYSVDK